MMVIMQRLYITTQTSQQQTLEVAMQPAACRLLGLNCLPWILKVFGNNNNSDEGGRHANTASKYILANTFVQSWPP